MNFKKMANLTVMSFLLSVSFSTSYGQLSNVPLSNANGGKPHYTEESGRNLLPKFNINDSTFTYDPNNPNTEGNRPIQTQKSVNDDFDSFFPAAKDEDNWWEAEMAIPSGKALSKIDIWGRTPGTGTDPRHKDLVITLSNDSYSWQSQPFNGVSGATDSPPSYGRYDLTTAGVTDDLLKTATKIRFDHSPGNDEFLHITELRVAAEDDPSIGDVTAPVLSGATMGAIEADVDITVTSSENSTVYLVPATTSKTIVAIRSAFTVKRYAAVNTPVVISTLGFNSGDFLFYAIDLAGNISDASENITIVGDTIPPVLSNIAIDTVVIGTSVEVMSNEDADIYLVPSGTMNSATAIINNQASKVVGQEGIKTNLSTSNLKGGKYLIYALDASSNVSDSLSIVLRLNTEGLDLITFPMINPMGGKPHYDKPGEERNDQPKYAIDDPFSYDPNDPLVNAPYQIAAPVIGTTSDSAYFFAKDNKEDNFWECDIIKPENGRLYVIDIWARSPTEVINRARDLVFTLSNGSTSWTNSSWNDVKDSIVVEGKTLVRSYGRFDFDLAGAPDSLLKSVNHLKISHSSNSGEFLEFFEVRLAGTGIEKNFPPNAQAGEDKNVKEGVLVTLSAASSSDVDSQDALTFAWKSPDGIQLNDSSAKEPTFTSPFVDKDSSLVFILTANDGEDSSTDTVIVKVINNAAPVANAGDAKTVQEGDVVELDASGSSDTDDGTTLVFTWTAPGGITLANIDDSGKASFIAPEVEGSKDFTFFVNVNDGQDESKDSVVITVTDKVLFTKRLLDGSNIYPNPSSNSFTIDLKDLTGSEELIIFNASGQEVYKTNISGISVVKLNETDIPDKGIYSVRIITKYKILPIGKLVKE